MRRIIGFIFVCILAFSLFSGCSKQIEQAGDAIGKGMDTVRKAADSFMDERAKSSAKELIAKERATEIAVSYAGVTKDQVKDLSCEYDIEDGVPAYDVEFLYKETRYEYKINAQSGEVMSFDMENR